MRPSGGRFRRHGGPALGLALAGLLVLAACTGRASPGDRRSVAPGTGGCPVASGDGGWRRLAVLTGSGAETAAEVTGVTAGSNGQPWVAVGAVRSGGPPPSIGTPVNGADGQSGTPSSDNRSAAPSTDAVGQSPTTAPAGGTGSAGGLAAAGTLAPAVWTSRDGAEWTRAKVEPVTLDGAVDRLLGVARWGSTAAAVGVAFNRNEGVARPSAWASQSNGPWREAPANRELFGGPAGQGVTAVGAGPLGLAVLGPRTGSDNRTFVAVWRSRNGRTWLPPQQDPVLTASPTEPVAPLGVAVGARAIVVTGKVIRVDDPADGAIWTGRAPNARPTTVPASSATDPATTTAPPPGGSGAGPGGTGPTPGGTSGTDAISRDLHWERVAPGPAGLGGEGVQEVDQVVAVGQGFVAAGLAGEPGRLQPVSWTSADGRSWRRWPAAATVGVGRLTSLTAGPGGLLAAGVAGSGACLWRSSDGRAWMAEPLPAAAARPAGPQRALAAGGGARTLLIVQRQVSAEVWARADGPG
jgi:hypothetical protein